MAKIPKEVQEFLNGKMGGDSRIRWHAQHDPQRVG
jgi:hypothetical protein